MATRTVKPKQTVATIAKTNNISEDQFYLANPGVKTLRPGQVVNVPKPFQFTTQAGGGTYQAGTPATRLNPFGTPATSTFTPAPTSNGYYGPTQPQPISQGGFQTPTTNGFVTKPAFSEYYGPTPLKPISEGGFQTPTTNGFTSANVQSTSTGTSTSTPAKPAGTYTGDPNDPNTAAWKAYWNYSAQNPSTVQTQGDVPRVMSRSEIWNMKADSRRKKMAKSAGDDQTNSGSNTPVMPTAQPQLVRSIVWGI